MWSSRQHFRYSADCQPEVITELLDRLNKRKPQVKRAGSIGDLIVIEVPENITAEGRDSYTIVRQIFLGLSCTFEQVS